MTNNNTNASDDESTHTVQTVGDIPVCPGCGFMSHLEYGDGICGDCWSRRNWSQIAGTPRVVSRDRDANIHETPHCPEFDADVWFLWPDEEACYHTLASDNDAEYCQTCKSYRLFGEFNVGDGVDNAA